MSVQTMPLDVSNPDTNLTETDVPFQKPVTEISNRTQVWGVGFDPVRYPECISRLDNMIRSGTPGYAITANLHYLMLTDRNPALQQVNRNAGLVVADGMPIVWRSRFGKAAIPERIAGSDLIYSIAELASQKGYRVFLLGGEPGVAQQTADKLVDLYPGLKIAGVECPPFRALSCDEEERMAEQIRQTKPHILLAALGQPQGEIWISRWYRSLGIPVCVQVGGSFNFVIGRVSRCPPWVASLGIEWIWRLMCEPRRLAGRYAANIAFLMKSVVRDLCVRSEDKADRQ